MGVIYKITSPSGKIYIGQTKDPKRRISDYRCKRYRSKRSAIMDSIKKYGWRNHVFEIVEEVDNALMDDREIFWIEKLNTYAPNNPNGMNLTKGGGGTVTNWRHDVERVLKARTRCGANAPSYGRRMSDEEKIKISKSVSEYNKKFGKKPSVFCHQKSLEKRQKPVVCYNLQGELLGEFESIKMAADNFGIPKRTANDAYLGNQKHAHCVIFRPKTGIVENIIDVSGEKFFIRKNVLAEAV